MFLDLFKQISKDENWPVRELIDLRLSTMGVVTWRKNSRVVTCKQKFNKSKSIIFGIWENGVDVEPIFLCQCEQNDKTNAELFVNLFRDWLIDCVDRKILTEKYLLNAPHFA